MASPTDPKTEPIARKAPLAPEPEAEPRLERRRPRLVSIHGAQLGKRWELPPCGLVIGRDSGQAGLILTDPAISARHCALEIESVTGEFQVSDLGSRNGTFVNGEKVGERRLCDGDKLFVGETVLEFRLDDELGAGFHSGIDGRLDIDALTGLLVKRAFDLELARAFALAGEGGGPLSVLMMDLDERRSPIDGRVLKHSALCIAEVGRIVREEVAVAGCACRFAGDDFLALLHPLETTRGLLLAERIRARVAEYAFERDGSQANPDDQHRNRRAAPGIADARSPAAGGRRGALSREDGGLQPGVALTPPRSGLTLPDMAIRLPYPRAAVAVLLLALVAAPLASEAVAALDRHGCCPDGAPVAETPAPCQYIAALDCCSQLAVPSTPAGDGARLAHVAVALVGLALASSPASGPAVRALAKRARAAAGRAAARHRPPTLSRRLSR